MLVPHSDRMCTTGEIIERAAALTELRRCAGRQFDGEVVAAFERTVVDLDLRDGNLADLAPRSADRDGLTL